MQRNNLVQNISTHLFYFLYLLAIQFFKYFLPLNTQSLE